jgi:hypothetical protein
MSARMRRYRARQKTGRRVVHVEIDDVAHVEALIAARLLHPQRGDDPVAIAAAIEKLLDMLVGGDASRRH